MGGAASGAGGGIDPTCMAALCWYRWSMKTLLPLLLASLLLASFSSGETRWFVVGPEPGQKDPRSLAYVLPLTEADDIDHARALMNGDADTGMTVVADIAAAGDMTRNRNYLAEGPGAPRWSWEVSSFTNYADITIEIYDGNPQLVEDDLAYWLDTVGTIGFWTYTVVGELPIQPEEGGQLGGFWKESSWFGTYNDEFWPWVYHLDEGWLYVFGLNPRDIWFYSPADGFFWSHEAMWPERATP